MPKRSEADLSPARNEILRKFVGSFKWTPHWYAEVTLAVEGLESRLVEVERYAGSLAVRSQLSEAHKFRVEAGTDINVLSRALVNQNRFQPVEAVKILEDGEVERVIAEHQLFSKAFLEDKYPIHVGNIYQRALRPHIIAVRHSSPEKQISTWYDAYLSSTNRHAFWLEQTRDAWLHPKAQAALQTVESSAAVTAPVNI